MAFFWNPAEKAHLIRRLEEKAEELKAVSDFFSKLDPCEPTVTVFGSARIGPDHPAYVAAEALGKELVRRIGAAVVTGGGQGIMEAANKGAYQEGGRSIGMCIQLNEEQPNPYLTEKVDFKHLGPRKEALIAMSSAFVVFPGGLGTQDELTDVLCRLKLGKMDSAPIVIYDHTYWEGLINWEHNKCVPEGTIDPYELEQIVVVDDVTQIVNHIAFHLENLD